jgi:hypothetical protein
MLVVARFLGKVALAIGHTRLSEACCNDVYSNQAVDYMLSSIAFLLALYSAGVI